MDIQQLVAAITACTNPDANVRKAGEDALKQVSHQGSMNAAHLINARGHLDCL